MHELRIALEIMEIAQKEMLERNIKSLKAIGIRIGALSGIDPESLTFCFDASKTETPLENAKMEVEYVLVKGRCKACDKAFRVEDFLFICPHCGSGDIEVEEGEEMHVSYLIGDDDE